MRKETGAYIIDDHHLFSGGMKELVLSLDGVSCAECFAHPEAAIEFSPEFELNLIVTDYYVPGYDMSEWIQRFKASFIGVPIAVVSSSISRADRATCLDSGAHAYFEKHQSPEHVLDGFQKLLSSRTIDFKPSQNQAASSDLTERQIDILVQLARGFTLKEIARRFSLSPETVKTHVSAIYRRLAVSGKTEAADWARRNGLI